MKSKALLIAIALMCFEHSFAQRQTNVWYFGLWGALDFNSGTPVVLTNGNTDTNEGTATISDSVGNLLFYTEGVNVWNRNNVLMPNGTGLNGDVSTTQTLIVPDPGNNDLFYIFTLDDEGGPAGLDYSIVDMTLDGGNGDVSVKNTSLREAMTEKVAAVYHCNNHDIWVMTHEQNTNAFVAYLVTDNGISAPVISNAGMIHTDVHGQMKFTSDGKKLACAIGYQDSVQVLDFDNKTGIVSNPVSLSLNQLVYGIEFSPDNSKLYVSAYTLNVSSGIYQFDLNASDLQASMVEIALQFDEIFELRALQLASDGKIYVSKHTTPFVCVINSPNLAGTACDFVDNAINIDPNGFGGTVKLGLPGFIQSYFHPDFPFTDCNDLQTDFTSSDTLICINDCISFTGVSACSTDTWQWTFTGASPGSSTDQNPASVCYTSAGDYSIELIASNGCVDDTIIKMITVTSAPTIDAGADVTINTGESTTLSATGIVVTYSWSPETGLSATDIANPVASPTVTTTYRVIATDENGCEATDSVTVMVENTSECGAVEIPDAFTPNNDNVNETAKVLGRCIVSMRFSIYNRWGEKVFETTNQSTGWDGTYKGEPAPISTFAYFFEGTLTTGDKVIRKGSISLIR